LLHQRYKDVVFCGIAKATVPNYLLRRYLMGASCERRLSSAPWLRSAIPFQFEYRRQPFQQDWLWLDGRNGLPFPSSSSSDVWTGRLNGFAACSVRGGVQV